MPAKDIFHDCVKIALVKDGWSISHDPYSLKVGRKDLFIDLGAEKLISAEKGSQKIAVEIKSFVSPSEIQDLENALGPHLTRIPEKASGTATQQMLASVPEGTTSI